MPVQQRRHLKYSVLYIEVPKKIKNALKALTFVHRAALDICHVATLSACKPHTCMLGIHTLLNMQKDMHKSSIVLAVRIRVNAKMSARNFQNLLNASVVVTSMEVHRAPD